MRTLRGADIGRLAAKYVAPPTLVTSLLWVLSVRDDISPLQVASALVLGSIVWVSYCDWRREKIQSAIPMFGMLAFAYWAFFALPLFLLDPHKVQFGIRPHHVSDHAIDDTMLMVLLGISCLWLGMRSRIGRRLAPGKVLDIRPSSHAKWRYLQVLLAAGIVLAFMPSSANYALGEGGRQVIMLLLNVAPLVAFILVLRRVLAGKPERGDKALVIVFLMARVIAGTSSGWLGATATLGVICAAVFAQQRRKVPGWIGLLIVGYIVLLQPSKEAFRKSFWYGGEQATTSDRLAFWLSESTHKWQEALTDDSGGAWKELAGHTLARASLLGQSANVLEMTPSIVPYQHGRLYSYMLVTLVPRFLWPEKPSASEANQFYQVAYGLTSPRGLDRVSIAIGTLTESYISFGWLGVPLIMIPLGIFFDFFQSTFLFDESGYLFNAIGLALIPNFLTIEAQLAQYLGGILQTILLVFIVMMPVMFKKRRGLPPEFPARRSAIPVGGAFAMQRVSNRQ
jgi:hypothetical protein